MAIPGDLLDLRLSAKRSRRSPTLSLSRIDSVIYKQTPIKVARIQTRIADRRRDFLQKLSSRLIDENQVICVEDLAVKNLLRNRSLARRIADSGWSEFVRQLAYKAQWYGRTFQRIGRFFPSSKRCSACGHVVDRLPLSVLTKLLGGESARSGARLRMLFGWATHIRPEEPSPKTNSLSPALSSDGGIGLVRPVNCTAVPLTRTGIAPARV